MKAEIEADEGVRPLHMTLPISLSNEVDKFRWAAQIQSRAKAIQALVRLGLETYNSEAQHQSATERLGVK